MHDHTINLSHGWVLRTDSVKSPVKLYPIDHDNTIMHAHLVNDITGTHQNEQHMIQVPKHM